ncbi:Trp biosynthesis-associated membrane protein [Actinospica sp. MGRD01-02]|uniref:Trp biosynthesis-associated membrane protein n=1 Tax=Actinospica acidithermotolerans TaxID=2828514 RepID=A0A941E809_9ACTN|nr:Trp biosynthesis-associated membrane protein [Actinospica acidithermotolerans]MBR7825160.1 Trp biosynthesis-associated membrane protein [Actinospica acidithermotolerans]
MAAVETPAAEVTEQTHVGPARKATRAKTLAALLAAVGAGIVLLTIGRGWADGYVTSPIRFKVTASGSQLTGVPYALGLAGLAGALALFAVRRIGRYLVGAVLALAGAGTVYSIADRLSRLDEALHTQAAAQGLGSDTKISSIDNSFWPYLTIAGGVILCAAGVYTLVRGRTWSGLGNRYESPANAAQAAAKPASEVTARDLWDAQGRGSDLTEADDEPAADR